jgi:hypothetical protein
VAYSLKKRWKDGTTHVVMTKQVLMERLCALVPRPRRHLVTYHGVFAPAAGIRRWVVPKVEAEGAPPASASGASAGLVAAAVRAVVGGGAPQPGGVSLQAELAESVRRSLSGSGVRCAAQAANWSAPPLPVGRTAAAGVAGGFWVVRDAGCIPSP